MIKFLEVVILSCVMLSGAQRDQHDVSLYRQYLLNFEKSFSRISEPARVKAFFEAVRYIRAFDTSKNNSTGASSSTEFTLGLNEMSDWLQHEVESRFSSTTPDFNVSQLAYASPSESFSESRAVANSRDPASLLYPQVDIPVLNGDSEGMDNVNWASSLNSKGMSVVSTVRNQGLCGACWAFVATSSVEAQVRIAGGKQIPLSVQELVDCDTAMNKGCNGGNPLYAFEYTMTNALTSWEDYPYRESASTCRKNKFRARSSIEGYRRLNPNDQVQLLKYVLMAPVAVGICGTDRSFMFYSKGIYNAANCCNIQNHAVLLVGYGHDTLTDLDYWVALNSWGSLWGEKGYVRLLRTNDSSSSGQCGLAMNPVAALGGYVLSKDDIDLDPTQEDDESERKKWNVHNLPFASALTIWLGNNLQTVGLIVAGTLMTLSLIMLAYTACSDYAEALDENRTLATRNNRNITQGQPDRDNQQFHPSNSLYYQQIPTCTSDPPVIIGAETVHSSVTTGAESRDGLFQSIWRGLTGSTVEYPANYYPGQTANLGQRVQEHYGVELASYSPTHTAHTSYFPQPSGSGTGSGLGLGSGSESGARSQGQGAVASYSDQNRSQYQSVDVRSNQQH